MKKIISGFLLVICCITTACNHKPVTSEVEIPAESTPPAKSVTLPDDFRAVHCAVNFGTIESEIIKNRSFLIKYNITPNIDAFPEKPDWKALDKMYQRVNFSKMSDYEQQLYKQVVAIQILRNHALLAETTEKEKIAFYTKAYVEAGGSSAGLLYFCLNAIGDTLDPTQKAAYIRAIKTKSAEVMQSYRNWIDGTKKTIQQEQFKEEMADSLEKDFAYIEEIMAIEQAFIERLEAMPL
ncbi:MAG: hypothetical protein ACK4TA_05590 [Saprospiraceae bacterium]